MQLLPRPPRTSFPLFPDLPPDTPANVPYVYDLIRHPPSLSSSIFDDPNTATYIITSYTSSLHRLRPLLDIQRDDESVPHNVIMTREWAVVIPRRNSASKRAWRKCGRDDGIGMGDYGGRDGGL